MDALAQPGSSTPALAPPAPRVRRGTVLRRDMFRSTADGTAYCVMVGIGETYVPAFVLAASLGEVASGLVATVPLLAGAIIQLGAPAMARRVGWLRAWVVLCASIQALSFVPLAVMAWMGRVPAWAVFLAVMVYWGSGMAAGPAWTTWVGGIFPARMRSRYFGRRSRICQMGVVAGLLIGGLVLEWGKDAGRGLSAFAVLFAGAAIFRGISTAYLAGYSDPGRVPEHHRDVGLRELLHRVRHAEDGRFILYLVIVQVAVQIAQPFFTPYMLGRLAMSYDQYLALVGASFVAKALAQPMWGGFAHRYGVGRLLWIGGLGIVPLPALWLFSDSFVYLLGTQLVAGALWGAYELATLLLMFETIREEERTSLLAMHNLGNAGAMVAGSLLGGALLGYMGTDHGAYIAVFVLSLAARLGTVLVLSRARRPVFTPVPLAIGVDAVRPSSSIDKPILASLGKEAVGEARIANRESRIG